MRARRRDDAAPTRRRREDGSGALDKEEVTRALIKTFALASPVSPSSPSSPCGGGGVVAVAELRATLDAIWPVFDDDDSGVIEQGEWCRPDGLCDAVIAAQQGG